MFQDFENRNYVTYLDNKQRFIPNFPGFEVHTCKGCLNLINLIHQIILNNFNGFYERNSTTGRSSLELGVNRLHKVFSIFQDYISDRNMC